jgi:hypothetical protein
MNSVPNPMLAALRVVGEQLPADVRASIVRDPATVIPELLAILGDDELALETAPDGGWAPIHAVDVLTELRATQAIEPMLKLLGECDWDEILHARILARLPAFGALALEPALVHLSRSVEQDSRRALCCVLSKLGVRDERIYQALCALFDAPGEEISSACCFADYGDPRALALLDGAISDFEFDSGSASGLMKLKTLVEAYESFGEPLSPVLRDRVAALEREEKVEHGLATEERELSSMPADRRKASAVVIVDTTGTDCDAKAAEALIAFAGPEVKALGRRRTVHDVHETLLWCAFAWNHALELDATDILELSKKNHGEMLYDWLRELFERRRRDYAAASVKIGPLRTTRMSSGAVRVHVDRT